LQFIEVYVLLAMLRDGQRC